ncbi:MAG: ferredoxin--NADP reductase [Nitrospirales bacterium]|nr:FAD-binding oxidoreductase [Nitrospirales bacterium]
MSWQSYRVKIASVRMLVPDVSELTLTVVDPPALTFQPGQAIAIAVPTSHSEAPIRRYYSLTSAPSSSNRVCLLFDQGEQGIGSEYLRNQSVGQELVIQGPFGSFCLQDDPDRELLFIATGTGIAPIRSMIASMLENGRSQPVTLLWGLRRESDIYFFEEFESWTVQYPQFSFTLTLSQGGNQWPGHKGRVTQLLRDMKNLERYAVYVCGGRKMVREVTALLHQRGVTRIYRERHHESE